MGDHGLHIGNMSYGWSWYVNHGVLGFLDYVVKFT